MKASPRRLENPSQRRPPLGIKFDLFLKEESRTKTKLYRIKHPVVELLDILTIFYGLFGKPIVKIKSHTESIAFCL